jgi:hypothetical protein
MERFNKYVAEAVNSHMQHLGDLPFLEGVAGTRKAIDFLRDLRLMLRGDSASAKNTITIKFDGAPAVFCGIDPTDGKFFVAKKGIFNKNPKIYKTPEDIKADLSGDLAEKFFILLRELPKLGIKSGIYQGDLMYTKSDLKKENIDGEEYITFHPNTIVYAVPTNTTLAKKIQKSNLGIVFHTTYTGNSFDSLNAEFGKPIVTKFKTTPSVWAVDATLSDDTGVVTLDSKEQTLVDSMLSQMGKLFRTIDSKMLNTIHQDGELLDLVLIYINSLVRKGQADIGAVQKANGFKQFITDRYNTEIEKRKTEKAKQGLEQKKMRALQYFLSHNPTQIAKIFLIADMIETTKNILISKMNKIGGMSHFLKTKNGFRVTAPEGFVAIADHGAVKLVDRLEFAAANFSPEITKGWER